SSSHLFNSVNWVKYETYIFGMDLDAVTLAKLAKLPTNPLISQSAVFPTGTQDTIGIRILNYNGTLEEPKKLWITNTSVVEIDPEALLRGVINEEQIELRPTETEIKSSFNMTNNTISLLGQSINMTGKVTYSSLNSNVTTPITTAQNTANTANSNATTALTNA